MGITINFKTHTSCELGLVGSAIGKAISDSVGAVLDEGEENLRDELADHIWSGMTYRSIRLDKDDDGLGNIEAKLSASSYGLYFIEFGTGYNAGDHPYPEVANNYGAWSFSKNPKSVEEGAWAFEGTQNHSPWRGWHKVEGFPTYAPIGNTALKIRESVADAVKDEIKATTARYKI